MGFPLADLLALLDLEELEVNLFRGASRDIGSGRVFGGQVLAQALSAAGRTVDPARAAHSLHSYFILPGDVAAPIVYFVERLRDGRSFTTRRVTAIQHGQAIFEMSASFQVAEAGITHQAAMPRVPAPESLVPDAARAPSAEPSPSAARALQTGERPIDIRTVEPADGPEGTGGPTQRCVWVRAIGAVPSAELLRHQSLLAYVSDYGLLGTAFVPHGLTFGQPGFQAATLDHSLWFHRPFRADEWLLYATDSPSASGARGFARGSVFTRDGTLVASVAQEGLVRVRAAPPDAPPPAPLTDHRVERP